MSSSSAAAAGWTGGPVDRDVADDAASVADADAERIRLLERRWQREREARLEAEQIAETGLRRLWEAKNDLDRRVEERTAELVRAQALTEASARAKTEFLAELAHRVRTPLQTILSALELASPATPTDRQRLGDASGAAVELRQLFTNLMELTQLETGTLRTDPRPVHLRDVLDEIGVRWRETLTARGLLLVPEASGDVVVDDARLHQIADALLDNVARFSRPGVVRVQLTVDHPASTGQRSSDRTPPEVVLTVADDGPGLTASQLETAFEPFATFGAAASGSGIGLALVRELCTQLGGTVTATGEPGVTVVVRIPGDAVAPPVVDPYEGTPT